MLKSIVVTFTVGLLAIASLPFTASLVRAGSRPDTTQSTGTTTPEPRATAPATAPSQTPTTTSNRYVALGDSVAAGDGLPLLTTPTAQDRVCRRSAQAYPHLVAQARGLQLTHTACSGATAGDLLTRQGIRNAPDPARQIAAVFGGAKPQLVTVTAGANDARWREFLYKCRDYGCGPDAPDQTISDSRIFNGLLVTLQEKYRFFFREMRLRSNGTPPTVVVTGYYNPVSSACPTDLGISAAELIWIGDAVDALNQTISDITAQYAFARFVPVDFNGHDICSADPWVQGLGSPAPIHPTEQGQRVIADAVLGSL